MSAAGIFGGVAAGDHPDDEVAMAVTTGAVTTAATGFFVYSAVTGLSRGSRCRQAIAAYSSERNRLDAVAEAERQRLDAMAWESRNRLKGIPLEKATLRLTNGYSESVIRFRVLLPDTQDSSGWSPEIRLAAGETKELWSAIDGRLGQKVRVEVEALSLGVWRTPGSVEVTMSPANVLHVVYDYDMATATFRIRGAWEGASDG
jgi:hypothetical protein